MSNGIIPKYGNFDIRVPIPVDGKQVKPTLEERDGMDFAYVGLLCFVEENKTLYILTELPATDPANWQEVGSGDPADLAFDSNRPITKVPAVGQNIGGSSIKDFLDFFYDFVAATMSLSSPPLYEKGLLGGVTVNLTANVTANSETVFANGRIVDTATGTTVATFTAGAGSRAATPILNVTSAKTYRALMDVGNNGTPSSIQSGTVTANFAAPTYYGVVANLNPTEAQIKALTKRVRARANDASLAFTGTGIRFCYAYPASFGALASVIDQNGFNVTDGFVATTANFTLPDGTTEAYRIYTLANPTDAANFRVSFNF